MAIDFTGSWKNQHESTLELNVLNGVVSGRFESGVGDDKKILWVAVSGRTIEDVITFNAVFEKYGTLVAWVGQHTEENGVGKIKTHWLHATNVDDSEEKDWMWSSNRIGSDVFTRV